MPTILPVMCIMWTCAGEQLPMDRTNHKRAKGKEEGEEGKEERKGKKREG